MKIPTEYRIMDSQTGKHLRGVQGLPKYYLSRIVAEQATKRKNAEYGSERYYVTVQKVATYDI